MLDIRNEFRQPICIDSAPQGKTCEWCGKPAIYQITVTGGIAHNDEGFFCSECAKHYTVAVADVLNRTVTAETASQIS